MKSLKRKKKRLSKIDSNVIEIVRLELDLNLKGSLKATDYQREMR